MIARLPMRAVSARPTMDRLIDRYGAMPVIWALIRSLLMPRRRQPRPPDIDYLSAHMRRDLGLPPQDHRAPRYYELR